MAEVRLIDANALKVEIMKIYKDYIDGNFFWTKVFNLIDNAPTVDLKDIYQEGHYDGQLEGYTRAINEEITDEDIRDAIKQGYKDGYAMARAKFERPKGDIEFAKWVADQIFFKEVKDDLFVELACRKLEKLGLVEKTESEWILRGGGENE